MAVMTKKQRRRFSRRHGTPSADKMKKKKKKSASLLFKHTYTPSAGNVCEFRLEAKHAYSGRISVSSVTGVS